MRWKCRDCGSTAITKNSRYMSNDVREVRYQCTNEECSASFVVMCSFEKYLNPGTKTMKNFVSEYLKSLPADEKQQMLAL